MDAPSTWSRFGIVSLLGGVYALPVKGGGHPRSRIGGKRIVDIAGGPAEQTDAVPAHEVSPCFARRRSKATSEHGQPRVRCPLTKESSDVVSLPSERPGRASPTSALLGLLTFAGCPTVSRRTSSTLSPLAYRVQEGSTKPTGALCPHRLQVDEVRRSRPHAWSTTCALSARRGHAQQPEPTWSTSHELVS